MAKAVQLSPFEAFKDALSKETGEGRDLGKAREISDAYIAEHPEQFLDFSSMTVVDAVKAADVFRAAGMEDALVRVEMWIRSKFETQQIGGQVEAERRFIPGFDE